MFQYKTLKDLKNPSIKAKTAEPDPLNLYTLDPIDEYDQAKVFVGDRFEPYYAKQWGMEEPLEESWVPTSPESQDMAWESDIEQHQYTANPADHIGHLSHISHIGHTNRIGRLGGNKSAFLLGYFWFAYRKMYSYAILFFIITTFSVYAGFGWSVLITLLLMVTSGLLANRLYRHFMEKKLKKINELIFTNETHKRQRIAQSGGTSIFAVAIFVVLTILGTVPIFTQLNDKINGLMDDQRSSDVLEQVDQM